MKIILTTLKILFFLFLLSSCGGRVSTQVSRFETLEPRERDSDLEKRIKERFKGDSCEDLIDDKRRGETLKCEKMCREIYGGRDKDECEELSEVAIKEIHELHEILEKPDEDDLDGIDSLVFENYLDIHIRPFGNLIEDYSQREAEKTLAWILNSYNDEIFKIFEGEDDDFRLLEELLEQFSNKNVNESNLARIFSEDIADEHSLMEYLIKEAEDKVFDYLVFDYVEESSNKCSDDIVSLPCFREIYCEIGRELDEEVRAEMIRNFEEFSDYIEKIIDNRINSRTAYNGEVSNANGWRYGSNENNGQIDELSDVESRKRDETWVDLLCQAAPAPPATE